MQIKADLILFYGCNKRRRSCTKDERDFRIRHADPILLNEGICFLVRNRERKATLTGIFFFFLSAFIVS